MVGLPNQYIYKGMVIVLTIMEDIIKRNEMFITILDLIRLKPLSIAEIGRRININRSTLRYYLSLLKEEHLIIFERQRGVAGQPTLIKFDDEQLIKKNQELKKKAEEYNLEQSQSPYTKNILKVLSKNKRLPIKEIFESTKVLEAPINPITARTLITLNWLKIKGLVNEYYSISKEGKEFLENMEVSKDGR